MKNLLASVAVIAALCTPAKAAEPDLSEIAQAAAVFMLYNSRCHTISEENRKLVLKMNEVVGEPKVLGQMWVISKMIDKASLELFCSTIKRTNPGIDG